MPLTRDEAASALADIQRTERRSFSLQGYRAAAPHLMLWGAIWVAGYGGTYLAPQRGGAIWFALIVIGSVGATLIGMRMKPRGQARFDWRIFFTWIASLAAISSIFAIFAPVSSMQVGTLFPLIIGWAYVILGIWLGWRFSLAGLAIVALSLYGFFALSPQTFLLWMAGLGGSVLIGTGLWLRTA